MMLHKLSLICLEQCLHNCLKSETSVCVKNQCVCALGIKNNGTCVSSK